MNSMTPNYKPQGVNEKQLNQSICCGISIEKKSSKNGLFVKLLIRYYGAKQ
jgi:hypothetical protein